VTTKLLQSVIDQLQLDISPETLKDRVNVSADGTNLLINIEVKDPVQAYAPKIAQAIADAFVVKHSQDNLQIDQLDRILVDIQDGPTPVQLFSPQTKINAAAGGILGALVGLLIVFLLEYLESSYVRNAEDVERLLGLTVLGSIPTMTEKGTVSGEELRARRWFWQRA
jgi:capsular polysaccharide biosynthesis protein